MSIENRIIPIPQKIEYLDGEAIILGEPGKALYCLELSSLPDDPLA
ncbi:MAG: hypothetical protein VB070_04615 [Clostridiaceae bacterium]|nr:hypothetical protein [Clostridiaceae bacterium]